MKEIALLHFLVHFLFSAINPPVCQILLLSISFSCLDNSGFNVGPIWVIFTVVFSEK